MNGELENLVLRYFRDQLDPIEADKRGIVVPRSSLRRLRLKLDAARNEVEFKVEGDMLYADSDSNGTITIRLNSEAEDPWPIKAQGGVQNVPIKSVLVTHAAQSGKVLNLWYGYRARFVAPSADIATIGSIINPVDVQGTVGVQGPRAFASGPLLADLPVLSREAGIVFGASYETDVALIVATETVFTAAANGAGAMLWGGSIWTNPTVNSNGSISLHAHTVAPTVFTDGNVLLVAAYNIATNSGQTMVHAVLPRPIFIPAGLGLFFLRLVNNEFAGRRNLLYTLF